MKIKNSLSLLIIGLLFVLVVGFTCRYNIQQFGDQILVVNNFTGSKELVSASGEVSVPYVSGTFKGVELQEIETSNPLIKLRCKIKWRDGSMYYWVVLDMDVNKFNTYRKTMPRIIAVFVDADGFTIAKQEIPLHKFVYHSDSSQGRWEGSFNSAMPMRLSDFKAIANWGPEWTSLQ